MALQKQVIPIPFAQGIDTKSDPKQVVAGKLLSLFNGVFQSAKRILKRNGYKKLSNNTFDGAPISLGVGLKSYENELIELDGSALYTYGKENNEWKNHGGMNVVNVTSDEIISQTDPLQWNDSAYHTLGFYGYSYSSVDVASNRPLYLTVTDASTGAIIFNQKIVSDNTKGAKIQALGNYFVVVYENDTTNHLDYIAIDVTAPTSVIGPVLIASDIVPPAGFDTTIVNSNLYIAYRSTGATSIGFYYLTPTLVLSSRLASQSAAESANSISITGDASNNIWLAYSVNASQGIRVSVYSEFIASVVLVNTNTDIHADTLKVRNITMLVQGTTATLYYSISSNGSSVVGDTATQYIKINGVTIVGGDAGGAIFIRSLIIYSKCFLFNGQIFLPTLYSNLLQPTIYILDASASVAAKILTLDVQYTAPSSTGNTFGPLPNTNLVASGEYEISTLAGSTLGSSGNIPGLLASDKVLVGNALTSSMIMFNLGVFDATLAMDLHLSGGQLWMYDGVRAVESGFNIFPDYITLTDAGAGGALSAGTYEYSFIYEWIDAKGNHHRSAPAPFTSITVAAGHKVTVVGPTLRVTAKSNVIWSIYRTSADGTTLRRVTALPRISNNFNDPSVDTFTYTDNEADANLAFGDILYTTGGEVENIAPPASATITTFRSRLILFPSEQTTSFWYSKEVIPGFPVEMSDLFVQNIDELGGPITAGLQMDDKLIIFKNRNIFYMTGTGPSPSGTNNDFSSPLLINSDVGAVDQKSVVLMPNGIMFKSNKGIYLLDRSLSASYIGAEVEAYNGDDVTSAQLMKTVNQVRFTLNSGVCLVYDYFFQQWSVFSNIAAGDSCRFEGNFTYLKPDGTVMEETPGLYLDDTSFIPLSGTTAWLGFAGVQGFQRVYKALILGAQDGNHTLVITVAYDFDPTVVQTDNIDATAIAPTVYQWRIFPIRQKCEAIQLSFADSQIAPFNEGFSISDLTLEVGIKSGADKLPASQSFG